MTKLVKCALVAFAALFSGTSNAQWYQGPTGGTGGTAFDFWQDTGGARDISEIDFTLDSDDDDIRCITIGYRDRPASKIFEHGSHCRDEGAFVPYKSGWTYKVYPWGLKSNEYIVGITGTYGEFTNSLTFYTNLGGKIAIGRPGGRPFGYAAPKGQRIVALTGNAGERLDAIGVIYAPIPFSSKAILVPQPSQ